MKSKITVGNWEAVMLLLNLLGAKIYLGFPRETMETAGTAGWILTIYISLLALIGFAVISKLYSRFEGKDLLDIGEHIGGNTGRVAVGLIILMFLLYIVPTILRIFAEDMKIISFPASPISFITLFFIAGMITAAYLGLEAITRIAGIFVFAIALSYIFIIVLLLPYFDTSNILPILGSGMNSIIIKGSLKISSFSELILLFMLIPFLKTDKNFKTVGYWTVILTGIFFVIGSLSYILIFQLPNAMERILPVYQMARLIDYGRFFQRIEPLFLVSWAAAGLMYVSTGFFFIVYIFRKTFKLQYNRPLILPFAVIVFTISLIPANLTSTFRFEATFFRNWSWLVTFGMTILLLIIARFVKKGRSKDVSNE